VDIYKDSLNGVRHVTRRLPTQDITKTEKNAEFSRHTKGTQANSPGFELFINAIYYSKR